MRARPTIPHIWSVTVPIIFAGVGETIIDVTDTIFLGHYGVTELGAVALADSLYEMVLVLTVGLLGGMQVVMARRAGENDTDGVGAAFNQGLRMLAVAAILVFVLVKLAAPTCTGLITGSSDVQSAVDGFLGIVAFAVFFEAIHYSFAVLYVTLSRTRVLFVSTSVLAAVNIGLDWCLIFGNLGLPRMGIEGAALASVAAELAACVTVIAYAVMAGDVRRYGLFRRRPPSRLLRMRLLRVSWPVTLEALVEGAGWFLFFVVVARLGDAALAMSNILFCCLAVMMIPIEGFSETTCSMVGNVLGQDQPRRIALVLRRTIGGCFLVAAPIALLALLQPDLVLSVFTDDAISLEMDRAALMAVVLAGAIAIPGELLVSAVAGTGDTRAVLGIETVASGGMVAGTAVTALLLDADLHFVWLWIAVAWTLRIALAAWRLALEPWRHTDI